MIMWNIVNQLDKHDFSCGPMEITWKKGNFFEKTLTLPKDEDIILNCMTQRREKWDSVAFNREYFWMVWRWRGIPFFHLLLLFFFLFRTNGIKRHLNEIDFCHGYGNYYERAILKITWYQLCWNFFLKYYVAHWQPHLKDTLELKMLWTRTNICVNHFLGKCHETKKGKNAWETIIN